MDGCRLVNKDGCLLLRSAPGLRACTAKEAAEPVLVDVPEAASRSWNLASWRSAVTSASMSVCFVLFCYLGTSHHQADACHLASVYLGFRSIWNTHFCLRLQPHLYPSLVVTSLGRDIRPNNDISQRMSSPTPPSETRNYC